MSRRILLRAVTVAAAFLLTLPGTATADPNPPTGNWSKTANLESLGWAPRPASAGFNSDVAFWGDVAYNGTYWGFHIIDISNPEDPVTINNYEDCRGSQGDVIIWGNILVRSWNSNANATVTCDGELVGEGFEGLHIFDVSNPADPDLIADVNLDCGSHTATGVPDPANNRLLVYNNPSDSGCPGFEIVEIPLTNPSAPQVVGQGITTRACHDTAVILGNVLRAACAGGNGYTMLSLGGPRGGSLTAPKFMYSRAMEQDKFVTIGHAATFSWDGRIVAFGHEPGGGTLPMCTAAADGVRAKTMYFFDTDTGTQIGEFTLPRPQGGSENCTIHNFNVVPSTTKNILVGGNYQAGIMILDFTNPGRIREIAFADPPALPGTPPPTGGDWSTHWYDGFIYESDITRGLLTWRLNDDRVSDARMLGHLNPQTQEGSFEFTGKPGGGVKYECRKQRTTVYGTGKKDVLRGTPKRDVFSLGNGKDKVRGAKGNDIICGGRGNDTLRAGSDKDFLIGGPGVDTLIGGAGDDDTCRGGTKKDLLRGCERGAEQRR